MFRQIILYALLISGTCAYPQTSFRDYVAVLENRTMGDSTAGFGSCFLWIDPRTQDNYFISCEHVVRDAHHLVATFQKRDGELISIEDIEIVLADKRRDIAFLSIGPAYRQGLRISLQPVEEGITEVWSAGFPALGLAPVFQISKGYITNSSVTIIPHGKFIQHDANISAASSGGPLMTAAKTLEKDASGAADTFAVVGVNSAVARDRPNTFFAIPSPILADFLERALKQGSPEDSWEKEGNNTRDSAAAIHLDTEINGMLNPLHDEDWYRLDIPVPPEEPFDVVLAVKGDDPSVTVYNVSGETIQAVKNTDGTMQFRTQGGPVFIRFKQKEPYFDVYSLKVSLYTTAMRSAPP
jgi:hypothetical protein